MTTLIPQFDLKNGGTTPTGAVNRAINQKLAEIVSVKDFGATGNGTTDDTAAIQAALDSSYGGLFFPEGTYKVTKASGGAWCLNMTSNKSLYADKQRNTIIRADLSGGDTTTNILNIAITSNGGYTDVRDLRIENLLMICNGGGLHCINASYNASYLPILNAVIQGCNLSGYGTYGRSIVISTGAFWTIQENTLGTGIAFTGTTTADGNKIINNNIFGTNVGIYFDVIFGSYSHIISQNVITSQNGAIYIGNGSQVKILNNQIEQQGVNAGINGTAIKAHIWVDGYTYSCNDLDILGNNFGGGANLDDILYFSNSQRAYIDYNTFSAATNVADIIFTSASSLHNVGTLNRATGRSNSAYPLVVGNTGTSIGGVPYNPTYSNSWTGGQIVKQENNLVTIITPFTSGTYTTGTQICVIPDGFRPPNDTIVVCGDGVGAASLKIVASTGVMTVVSAASNVAVGVGGQWLTQTK
jgi:hypothetical protein